MVLTPSAVLYPPADPDDLPVAELDWATGLIRMFIPFAEWQELLQSDFASLDADGRFNLEAVTHEFTHLLQLSTLGYPYEIAVRLLRSVATAVREHETLDAIFEHRANYAKDISTVFASLHRVGPNEISPIVLLESAAFHAQKTTSYPNIGPNEYEQLLDADAPDERYRLAYDVAVEHLGNDAFDQFPHIANLALCVQKPEVAFAALLEEFRLEASRTDIEVNHRLGVTLLNDRFADILLGSAADRKSAGSFHPILSRLIAAFNQLEGDGQLNPMVLMAHGRVVTDDLASVILSPVFFPPTSETNGTAPMLMPPNWTRAVDDNPILDPKVMRLLCAGAQLLQQHIEPIEPPPLRPPRRPTIPTEANALPQVRALETRREDRTLETAANLARLLRELDDDPTWTRTLRGTVNVTFPDDEFPGDTQPLADPGVRAYLHELFEQIPHLLYYLADFPRLAALSLAIAAYAPAELVFGSEGAGFAVTDEALSVVAYLERRAVQFARDHGQEARVVFGHLRPFEAETRATLQSYAAEE